VAPISKSRGTPPPKTTMKEITITPSSPGLLRDATSRGGDSGHLPVFGPYITEDIGFIHGLAGALRRWRSDRWRGWRTGTAAEDRYAQCQRQR